MDLLFKRYASPFSFIDGMIQTGRFSEFVTSFAKTVQEEDDQKTSWEFFLHRVFDKSFTAFKKEMQENKENLNMSDRTIETTIQHSMNILNNFSPDEGSES